MASTVTTPATSSPTKLGLRLLPIPGDTPDEFDSGQYPALSSATQLTEFLTGYVNLAGRPDGMTRTEDLP